MRDRSPVERIVAYATFLSLSIAVHLVVILGDRGRPFLPGAAVADEVAPVASERPAAGVGGERPLTPEERTL